MDKTLEPAELILLSWSDWELWRDLRCCRSTRFTAAADSANKESSFEVLFFLIFAGVVSSAVLLLLSQGWLSTSPADSLRLGVFTSSFWMRSLASSEMLAQSRWWNSKRPSWMLLNRLIWQRSQAPPCAQPQLPPQLPEKGG